MTLHDTQMRLEEEMVSLGVQRYDRERPMPWKEGNSSTRVKDEAALPPGAALVRRNTERVATIIAERVAEFKAGKAARHARTILARIADVDPEALAFIALRRALTGACREEAFTALATAIGSMVEEHIAFTQFRNTEKDLANWWERKASKGTTDSYRRAVMRAGSGDYLQGTDWSTVDKLKVGSFLLEILELDLGLVKRGGKPSRGRMKPTTTIVPTQELREWLDKMHEKCSLLQPLRLPMVVEPAPWTTPFDGGYLTVRNRLMKNARPGQLDDLASTAIPEVYEAINTLQKVRWRIHKPVLRVLRELRDAPAGAPCIPAGADGPIPPRPAHIPANVPIRELSKAQQAELKVWRSQATTAHMENAKRRSRRIAFAQKVWVAEKLADYDAIYYPYQIDTRGRVYTIPTEISPQSDDMGKALMRFADSKPLGENGAYWLAVHVANSYGVDKVPFDERVQWVIDNEDMIMEVGLHGADRVDVWAEADSPWQFLAACMEWTGYVFSGRRDDFESSLPICMDGSCSGLQHFSAALRDEVGGRAVNLTNTGRVEDIYSEVARLVNERLNASTCPDDLIVWRGYVDRKIVKQPCMTYAYSATVTGMRGQIMHALEDRPESERPPIDIFSAAGLIAPVVRECIEEVVIAAAGAMEWMQRVAQATTDKGADLRWTSAIGLPVRQSERRLKSSRAPVWYGGKRMYLRLSTDTEVLDKRAQKSAVAPNWVHSQDAAHLMAVILSGKDNGLDHFSVVHDSFGVHACDVDLLNAVIRETFIEQYQHDLLNDFREEILDQVPEGTDIPELPGKGGLDLEAVRDSEYFFA